MGEETPRRTFERMAAMVVSGAVLTAVFALIRHLADVLLPFAIAVALAYLLNPLVTALERMAKYRGLAVGLALSGLGVACAGIIAVLIPLMLGQVDRFRVDVLLLRDELAHARSAAESEAAHASVDSSGDSTPGESAGKSTIGWGELMNGWSRYRADATSGRSRGERLAELRNAVSGTYVGYAVERTIAYSRSDEFKELLVSTAKKLAAGGWSVLTFAIQFVVSLTGLLIVFVYLVFLLLDFPEYSKSWKSFLPPQYRDATVEFLEQFDLAMRQYFRGQSVVALLTGTIMAIGFTVIGLPMAVPFGLFVGLLNMVPYLQVVALLPALLLAGLRAIEGDSSFLLSVGMTLAVFVIAQVIQDALITPRIMGKATGLRPVAILLGVFIWGKLLGFLGLILAIPLTCLGIAYYRRYVLSHGPEAMPVKSR